MVVVREYVDETGHSPFRAWFGSLAGPAAIKVTTALERIAEGHTSAMKALGVECQQVVLIETCAADWRRQAETRMRPVPVVFVDPLGEVLFSLG